MKFIIGMILYASIGAMLASIGHGYNTWQFWVLMVLVGSIDILSYNRAKEY